MRAWLLGTAQDVRGIPGMHWFVFYLSLCSFLELVWNTNAAAFLFCAISSPLKLFPMQTNEGAELKKYRDFYVFQKIIIIKALFSLLTCFLNIIASEVSFEIKRTFLVLKCAACQLEQKALLLNVQMLWCTISWLIIQSRRLPTQVKPVA